MPLPTWVSKKNYFAKSTYFKLSEYEDVSIINMIQIKFSCFLCRIVSYAKLQGCGQAVFISPIHPPGYHSKMILLIQLNFKPFQCGDVSIMNIIQVKFSFFLCSIVSYSKLQGWRQAVQGSLSCPHPHGYQVILFC